MKMIGIRSAAHEVRYAVLERDEEGQIMFINRNGEHCLRYPSTAQEIGNKLLWVKREFERIFRQNPDVSAVVIKSSEFAGNENIAKRESLYTDAILLLLCAEFGIPACKKLYSQIGTTSNKTKEHAEQRVGKTDKYWNATMADAVNCVFWEIRRA